LTLGKSKLLLVYCGAISRSIPKNGLERTDCCRMKGLSSRLFSGTLRNSPTCSVRWDERRAIANRIPYESRLISKSALKSPSFTKICGSTTVEIGANTGGVGRKMTLTAIAASRHWLTTTCIGGASRGLSASLSRGCCKTPIIQIRSAGPVILRRKGLDGVDLSCRLDRQPSKARSVSVARKSLDRVDQCCRQVKAQSKTRDSRGPARARWNSMLLKSETVGTSDAGSVPRSKHWPEPTTGDR
jgi:hypothetical protein